MMNTLFFPADKRQINNNAVGMSHHKKPSFSCFLKNEKSKLADSFDLGPSKQITSLFFGHAAVSSVQEIEKKARLDNKDDLLRIRNYFQPLANDLNNDRGLYNVYFDTPGNAIDNAGFCVRLRMNIKDNNFNQVSVKTHGRLTDSGTHDRNEYEADLPPASRYTLDFQALEKQAPESLPIINRIQELCGGNLENLYVKFFSKCYRTTFDLVLFVKTLSTGAMDVILAQPKTQAPPSYTKMDVEVALDDTVIYGKKSLFSNQYQKIKQDYEVELEYKPEKSGNPTEAEKMEGIQQVSDLIDEQIFEQALSWGGPSKQKRGYDAIEQAYHMYRGWHPSEFIHLGQPITIRPMSETKFGHSQPPRPANISLIA